MKPESIIQRDVRKYLATLGLSSMSVPNGSHLAGDRMARIRQMASMKADGFMNGWPDLQVIHTHGRIGFIEVKTPKGRVTQDQQNVQKWLTRMGHQVAVVRSVEDTREVLKQWGWLS